MATQTLPDKGHRVGTPGHSLALKYEVFLQEAGSASPTSSKLNSCFQVLDDLLPHLGLYQRVIKLVRDELHKGVYSSEWTSADSTNIAPIPYFVIAQRLLEKRTEEHSRLKAEISSLREQLYTCEADLEKALSCQEGYRHDLRDRDNQLHMLASDLHHVTSERTDLAVVLGQAQHNQDKTNHDHNRHISALRSTNTDLKEQNYHLSVYKETYDRLQEASLLEGTKHSKVEPVTSKSEVQQQLALSEKMLYQLYTMRNTLMDEYDTWMWTTSDLQQTTKLSPIDTVKKKKTFSKRIASINSELSHLEVHIQCLTKRFAQVSEVGVHHKGMAVVLPLHPDNPLIPQQLITNKHAAMLYASSDGGQTFCPLKGGQFCYSCAVKTMICPHKVCEDLVLLLPSNTSHLKICRPSLQQQPVDSDGVDKLEEDNTIMSNSQQPLHNRTPNFSYLQKKLQSSFPKYVATVPKKLSHEQLKHLMENFYVSLLVSEAMADSSHKTIETDEDEEEHQPSIVDSLLTFLHHHYLVRNLAPVACHALITALHNYHLQYKDVLLLSHILCGDLEVSALWYSLTQASLVLGVSWTRKEQLTNFFHTLYPFLEEEGVDQLCMSCVVHSNNRLSSAMIINFMQVLLLRHKDPLVTMMESKLVELPSRSVGRMLEVEFADAMENIVDGYSSPLGRRLFLQSLSLTQDKEGKDINSLPLRSLAYIAAYLYRLTEETLKTEISKLNAGLVPSPVEGEVAPEPSHARPTSASLVHDMNSLRLKVAHHVKLQTSL